MPITPVAPITIRDVTRRYPPVPCVPFEGDAVYEGSVIVLGTACWEAPPVEAYDNRIRFIEGMARSTRPGNLWITPVRPRMVYPHAPYWSLASAFATERDQSRRFDWFVWSDDDAEFTLSDVKKLLDVAKAENLKFVSALPYDRTGPQQPAVCEKHNNEYVKWVKAPDSGTYPVAMVGLLLAVFHRSVFDVVPEPWFSVAGPIKGFSGVQPDWWWCWQLEKAGLKPYVCCDTNVTHLTSRGRANRESSENHFVEGGVPDCAVRGKLIPRISEATGATVVDAPVFHDGRIEHEARDRNWSDATVVILTCDRDKELLDCCLKGLKVFWPSINVMVMKDTDRSQETQLPNDVREVVRRVPFLRKVFDLPYLSVTDTIFCLDSDCLLMDEPHEWTGYRGLYVLPGSDGQKWLNMGAEVWAKVAPDLPPIDTSTIFCGGCWSASRKLMFEGTREIAVEYVRECVRRGYDKMGTGYAVVCEQVLLNGLWHAAHTKDPLPNYRYPLDQPAPQAAIWHLHMNKGPETRRLLDIYRTKLAEWRHHD